MSKNYTSRYAELSFYVDGVERKFKDGVYAAKTPEEIVVLDVLSDAVPVDEPQEQPEETVKPAAKQPRKGAAKASE
ncbi:hypothetical protein [Paenibacillus sp. PDC88]|uniref:hypothetical protein n=1 Tax=Paenibacillus sp. PDC88 TaxID=1884375 RepID=UPI000899ED29|nr:hypothetical protein [Paenibacillus sp. PDC88]SDW22383.1 hypothetical protein SAMN05518848_101707 [Paenibacillus sp. PDC88]